MNIRKAAIIPLIAGTMLLTACGSSEKSYNSYTENFAQGDVAEYPAQDEVLNDEYQEDAGETDNTAEKKHNTSEDVIKKEMLVYTCRMSVDVLDFDNCIDQFKHNIESYGAFIEKESLSDDGSTGHWKYENEGRWKNYSATIRVPSADYESFCDATAALGDLRSKNANVDNLSREYYDLSDTLEIYEAKEQRYAELLKEITDDKYAISVEEELTQIQIEISKLKSRMNDIRTDVAYSYVYVTINEVKEYVEEPPEPVKTDTFLQRIGNAVNGAASSFLKIMENILIIVIYLFPHAVVIAIAVFIIVKIVKHFEKRKAKKRAVMYVQPQPPIQPISPAVPAAPEISAAEGSDDTTETDETTTTENNETAE